jgi:hypothetical protein
MPLTLQLVNQTTLPDGGPVSFQLSGKYGIDIGRAAHVDWTLPDPTRYISNKHCEIRYKDGGFWLHDVSTNGTFLNGADHRMQAPHRLRNGDRFTIGHYLVAVTLEGAEEAADETRGAAMPPPYVPDGQDPWADEGDVPPAVDPKQLGPAQPNALDWSADIPDPFPVPVADLPAPPVGDPATSSAHDDIDWAGPAPCPHSPPPGSVEQSSIGPVVLALRGGAYAAPPVARAPQNGPARLISLPALMTHASTPPPLGVQPQTLCRHESSASLTKTSHSILATKIWMARRIAVLDLGRYISRWVILAFGAGVLVTAVWFTAFFITSSENPSPQTSDTSPADTPELLHPLPTKPNSPEMVASGRPAPFKSAPEPLFRPPIQSPPLDQSTPPDQGRPSNQSALARPPKTESSTHNLPASSADAISSKPWPVPIFEGNAGTYWRLISEKRRLRGAKHRDNQPVVLEDYVLAQPPQHQAYSRSPDDESTSPDDESTRSPEYIPVAADFLKAAAKEFNFVPERPATEMEFKKTYARLALSAGLTRDQIVRIYAFETGGNGSYDTQAGLEFQRPGERAVSSAMGYNQLLGTNSVELLAEHGDDYLQELKRLADKLTGPAKQAMQQKIETVRRMVAFSRTVPDIWQEHDRLAKTTDGGRGIHALMFDRDIGPLLQTQKLVDSLLYARKKGYSLPLTAAELELMNLTGDGNGFDMLLMPLALRIQVPTANFFQPDGYTRNSIARKTGTVVALIAVVDARMDEDSRLPGARELAAAF